MKQRPSLYRNCSIPLSCLLACFFLSIAGAQAQTLEQCRETYQGQLDIVTTRNEEAIATAMESYRGGLHALRGNVQGLGDLDKTLAVRAEITRYVEKQTLPTSGSEPIPEIADLARQCRDRIQVANEARDKIVRDLQERYDRVLETLERRLTRDGDIEKALAVREERTLMQLSRATEDTGSLRPEPTPPETPVLRDPPRDAQSDPDGRLHTWRSVAGAEVEASFEELTGDFVVLRRSDGGMVRIRLDQLVREDQVLVRGALSDRLPRQGDGWTSPTTGMEFAWIEALDMWVGKHEVTNAEYRRKEPGHDSRSYEGHSLNGDRQPVVQVNYDDGNAYATWLTERDRAAGRLPDGLRYRLPTGEEWMTFAQCGDGRELPWGNNWPPRSGQAGNYHGQEGAGSWPKIPGYTDGHAVSAPVDALWENPWGLKGVGGNVWEMTSKTAGGDFDAWRGASWGGYGQGTLRCSYRRDGVGSGRDRNVGFRLVLVR